VQKSEIDYFKEILQSRKVQIEKNINNVSDEIQQINSLELSDEGDYASANNETLVEGAIIEKQKKELEEIDVALKKIANGEYGICEMCEDLIGFQRLKVKPQALYCIDCREIVEKSK